jgi:tetratricopeptide (TPR) repeat protein
MSSARETPSLSNRARSGLPAALVFALVLVCYWPALRGGLVWDDAGHVTRPELRSWGGLGRIWTDLHATQQYYPVLHSAFWFEHRLWGDRTLGYHLINVFWHGTAACLLALLLRRLWGPASTAGASAPRPRDDAACNILCYKPAEPAGDDCHTLDDKPGRAAAAERRGMPRGAEWVAAILFAVHPVCVESVAWISEQKNTLSLVFYLLAALTYLRFERTRGWAAYVGASGLFLLALGTKSVTATLPAALLVLAWWRRGALRWRTDVVPLLPWFVAALAAGATTAWVERTLIGASGAAFDLTWPQRVLLAGRVLWFYVGKLLWPANLSFVYPRWNVPAEAAGWWGWLLAALAVTIVLWSVRHRWRGPLAAWLFFAGSLFPALGFFNVYPFLYSYVADHFQYLASVGAIAAASAAVGIALAHSARSVRFCAGVALGGAVLALAVAAHRQSGEYRSSGSLYRATLARNPACWMAHNNLAVELVAIPTRLPEALAHYAEALRLNPDYAEAHNNLGCAMARLPGRLEEAIGEFRSALRIAPEFVEAHLNLASALARTSGGEAEALAEYGEAVRLSPAFAEGHYSFGTFLAGRAGRTADAIAEYQRALQLRPDYVEAHENLAALLARDPARTSEALAHYSAALRIQPGRASAHYNLALLLESLPDQTEAAVAEYEQALRLDPTYVTAHNNLGILHARRGRFDVAREHWEAALRLQPGFEDARRNLELLERRRPQAPAPIGTARPGT